MSNRIFYQMCLILFSTWVGGESFQWEFLDKKNQIQEKIGDKKTKIIERVIKYREFDRATQLLSIKGISEETVKKIIEVIGISFFYGAKTQICYKDRIC